MSANRNELVNGLIQHRLKFTTAIIANLAADVSLDDDMPTFLEIDPSGTSGRKAILPASAGSNEGRVWVIYNSADAAESLLIRTPADAGTLVTLTQGQIGFVINSGGTWRGCVLG